MTDARVLENADIAVEDPRWQSAIPDAEGLLLPVIGAALSLARPEGRPGELCVVLADDDTLQDLNRQFRQIDRPTNVLSFPIDDGGDELPPGVPAMLGDVYIAYETAEAEAAAQDKELKDHLRHLVVHGVLHLLGYDHQTDGDAETMEKLEAHILEQFGIRDPYDPERAAPTFATR